MKLNKSAQGGAPKGLPEGKEAPEAGVPPRMLSAEVLGSGASRLWFWAFLAAAGSAILVLFAFNPAAHGFYPRCLFKEWTGWQCPGCGGLRAAHLLLHGRVREAFAMNPFLLACGPLFVVRWVWRAVRRSQGHQVRDGAAVWWLLLASAIGFGIWRNLGGFAGLVG
jgi:hypothetical protein